MYSVIDICRYTIIYCNRKNYTLSNLKLQSLLYLLQAVFLCEKDIACFDDDIEAWDFGPVVPNVYKEYKHFGALNIFPNYINFVGYYEENIDIEHRKLIEEVLNEFSCFTANGLVQMTQRQDPWKNAYKEGKKSVIKREDIKKYFNKK